MNKVIIIFKSGEKVELDNVLSITSNSESMAIAYKKDGVTKYEYPAVQCISQMWVL